MRHAQVVQLTFEVGRDALKRQTFVIAACPCGAFHVATVPDSSIEDLSSDAVIESVRDQFTDWALDHASTP